MSGSQQTSGPMNHLLIVGGTGFIGQHLAKKALSRGYSITIISKSKTSRNADLPSCKVSKVDISNREQLKRFLSNKKFDYVVNLGGYVDHSNFFDGGQDVLDTHFNGLVNLVESIDRKQLRAFIQVGSSDEYGTREAPQKECYRERSFSPYSFAKLASTHFLQMLFATEGFPAVIFRPFLIYGPGQSENRLLPSIIKACLRDDVVDTSEGRQIRDFCHVDDFVDAVLKGFNSETALGEVINICSGNHTEIRELIMSINKKIGSGTIRYGARPYRSLEPMELFGECSKAKELLNWEPKVNLEKGIDDLIASLKKEL